MCPKVVKVRCSAVFDLSGTGLGSRHEPDGCYRPLHASEQKEILYAPQK
jgi:hypothetical protein